ncbi:hypothetical protein PC116_g25276 [Phytophthora cactorum]|uniref:Uncharacterized protein n=1 Tax=Phytophthora cactorum TaxID=29920 RepID=A0A8T1BL94_9STRA|nr:hypothetical protein PC112_g17037 [Phytophthora cactorum]KAG2816469.1 hypothetical protein PC111_g13138 [Phytophthora cactorum]KAG2852192.1 hypothetical protein PC113_g15238 [Phytophthora cactorum]KAG2904952.1 hypothetical protein PC117_g20874 [Phytophthora cactorum]KAG2995628.1 hypothetical protein PC119_g18009 [Phytophthora cactorum]
MVMSRSYVMEITTEVVRLLSETAPSVVGARDGSLIEIERPENFDGFYCPSKCGLGRGLIESAGYIA